MIKNYKENRSLRKNRSMATRATSGRRRLSTEITKEESPTASENNQMAKKRGRKSQQELLEKQQAKKTANNKLKTCLKENNKPAVTTGNKPELNDNDVASVAEHINPADNVSKSLTSASTSWHLNGSKFFSDFLTRQPAPKTGFERGLLPGEILGAAEFKDNIYLVIKFQGDDEPHMVHNTVANKEIPQMVIEFYEKSLWWQASDD